MGLLNISKLKQIVPYKAWLCLEFYMLSIKKLVHLSWTLNETDFITRTRGYITWHRNTAPILLEQAHQHDFAVFGHMLFSFQFSMQREKNIQNWNLIFQFLRDISIRLTYGSVVILNEPLQNSVQVLQYVQILTILLIPWLECT